MSFHETRGVFHIDGTLGSLGYSSSRTYKSCIAHADEGVLFCEVLHKYQSRTRKSSTKPATSETRNKTQKKSLTMLQKQQHFFSFFSLVKWKKKEALAGITTRAVAIGAEWCRRRSLRKKGGRAVVEGRSRLLRQGTGIKRPRSSHCLRSGSGSAGSATCPCPRGIGTWPCFPSAAELGPSTLRS